MSQRLLLCCFLAFCGAASLSRAQGAVAAPALPEMLKADLLGWYDAADDAAVSLQNHHIAVWKDKSAARHDLSAAVPANGPTRDTVAGMSVVRADGRGLLATGVQASLTTMTVYAVVSVAPGYSPIISFRQDTQADCLAAGWTVGAKPTWIATAGYANADTEVEDSQWHLLTFVRNGAERRFYLDGVLVGTSQVGAAPTDVTDFLLFAYSSAASFHGSLAELLIYRTAHDDAHLALAQQYLLAKWTPLFADRCDSLVAFVGNSITTGMYCGNGRTWSAQTAALVPGLTRWYNISKGGISTQGLSALAPVSIDPLLKLTKATGHSALFFFEGTNELVFNHNDAVAAHEAMKQFCLARRKAGWKTIVLLTVLPRQAGPVFETARTALNALLRAHYREYADTLVDLAANAEIGAAGCEMHADLYADGVHTTAKGNAVIAGLVTAALQGMSVGHVPDPAAAGGSNAK